MKIFIVRHGESIGNELGLTQGHKDYKLTQKGIEQTKKIAERIKNENINIIYSSDLIRANETTKEIIKKNNNVKRVEFLPLLREKSKGIFEGKPKNLINEEIIKSNQPYYLFKPKKGISLAEHHNNLKNFYLKIIKEAKNENILIVSHGETTASLILHLLNKPIENYKDYLTKNVSLSIFEIDQKEIKMILLNCINHLKKNLFLKLKIQD